jgi:hypothetical protein
MRKSKKNQKILEKNKKDISMRSILEPHMIKIFMTMYFRPMKALLTKKT